MNIYTATEAIKENFQSTPITDHKKVSKQISLSTDQNLLLKYRALLHIGFWVLLIIYQVFIWGSVEGGYDQKLFSVLIDIPIRIIATYFTTYYLIDKFLLNKKYGRFALLLVLSMATVGVIYRILYYYFFYPTYCPECLEMPLFFVPKIVISAFAAYSIVAIVASFHLVKAWYTHQQATQELQQAAQTLEKEKLEAELKLLKSQINPHFLFNTLNNLYVLTLQNSTKSPEMVYKLSQLMSYMLYESNQSEVLLTKEIEYIENYIALERLRHDDRLDVSLNIYGGLEGIRIAPLLILAFVENSFKHGVNYHLEKAWVTIDILTKQNQLIIKVENNKGKQASKKEYQTSGIGLVNVKKRLDLIYKDRYKLRIFDEEENYLVVLKISYSQI